MKVALELFGLSLVVLGMAMVYLPLAVMLTGVLVVVAVEMSS